MKAPSWYEHYDPHVPKTLEPYPTTTIVDVIRETARMRPHHPALWYKGRTISYRDLDRESDALAAALHTIGVRKGDRVALLLPNIPQFIIGELAAWKLGAISTPMNPLYTAAELEHAFNEVQAELAIVLTPFYDKVKSIQDHTGLRQIIATNVKEYLPRPLRFLFTLLKEKKEGHRIRIAPPDVWFQDLIHRHRNDVPPDVSLSPEDPALILFTGGTTGRSKAAVGAHRAFIMTGLQVRTWFGDRLEEWRDVFLANLPLFHVFAGVGTQSVAFMGRSTMALVPNPRDIGDQLATIEKTQATFMTAVPTLFIAMMQHPRVAQGKADLSSLKACISGAAPLLQQTKEDFERLTGARIVEGYALTESMMAATINPVYGVNKVGSVGMPVPDVKIRIVDAETGTRELPAGEIGEITMWAPQLMLEYWQRPEETAYALRDGWLYTGDLGYLDEDGYLFIVDRKKDVIKVSGLQVWPREVEEVIARHPAVAEVGVAGVPDPYQGEAVKAWVVLKQGHTATAEEIRNHCRQYLAPYKVPKYVEFRTELPKSAVGKLLRRELRKEG